MAIPYSRWYFNLYLISTLALAATMVGYSAMSCWFFDTSFSPTKYVVGFAILAAIGAILLIWSAYGILRHIEYANPGERQQKMFIVGSLCLSIALMIISIVMLGLLTAFGSMSYYVAAVIWMAINGVLGVLSLIRSVIVTRTERHNVTTGTRNEQTVIVQEATY